MTVLPSSRVAVSGFPLGASLLPIILIVAVAVSVAPCSSVIVYVKLSVVSSQLASNHRRRWCHSRKSHRHK